MSVTIQYLWKDRKRYFGLPLSFTRYSMSEDRLFLSVGFLNIKDDEILLYRVRDIDTNRSLWQRLFGVGTVTVVSSDKTQPVLALKSIKDPLMVKELIHNQVEECKLKRRVRVGEIMGDADGDGIPDDLVGDYYIYMVGSLHLQRAVIQSSGTICKFLPAALYPWGKMW